MDHPMIAPVTREHAVSRSDFEGRLREWSERATDAEWIGDDSARGQQPWIHVRHGGRVFALSADTKCSGVREYLRLVSTEPELAWSIVANQHGRVNKVAFGPSRITVALFYLYALDES